MINVFNHQVIPEVIEGLNRMKNVLSTVNNLGEQLEDNPSVIIRGRVPPQPGPGER